MPHLDLGNILNVPTGQLGLLGSFGQARQPVVPRPTSPRRQNLLANIDLDIIRRRRRERRESILGNITLPTLLRRQATDQNSNLIFRRRNQGRQVGISI